MRDLSPLLNPTSVAIIGASDDKTKIRGMAIQRLLSQGYGGTIHPVNPGHATIQGLPAHASVEDIPGPVDLALVAVASGQLIGALEAAGRKGVRAAVILTGLPGGPEGSALQDRVAAIARDSGMVISGPNTLGVWSPANNLAATFASPVETVEEVARLADRHVSIVSHSGGVAGAIYEGCARCGIGVRHVLSTGNEADLEMGEVIDWLVAEGGSRIILAYMEGLRRPHLFKDIAARAADAGVTLVILKAGSSEAGERAAVSHTAHMTGADLVYSAVFRQYGVERVDSVEEMLALTRVLTAGRWMSGDNVMVVSNGGGYGALMADACEARGVRLPPLDSTLRHKLEQIIPDYGSPANPVDLPGAYMLEDHGVSLARVIDGLAEADWLDAMILNFGLSGEGRIASMRANIEPALRRTAKPLLFFASTEVAPDNRAALAEMGVQCFTMSECAFALDRLRAVTRFRQRWHSGDRPARAAPAPSPSGDWSLTGTPGTLERHGIDLPAQRFAADAGQAVQAARDIGGPVAVKILAPDIPHKSDVGGVILGLTTDDEVRSAFTDVTAAAVAAAPDAHLEGVLVQRMAPAGRAFAIGVIRDPDFGPVMMLSAGGVLIEVMDDSVLSPLPITPREASRMVDRLKSAVLLEPLRGDPASDRAALERLLVAVSQLVEAEGAAISELEFNPVLVHPAGEGLSIVDHLVVAGIAG